MRSLAFTSKSRPELPVFNNIIIYLIKLNVISEINKKCYKLNLMTKNGRPLTYNYIIVQIKRECAKNNNFFTFSKVLKRITHTLRPNSVEWNIYLETLVFENVIYFDSQKQNQIVYTLR